MAIMLLMSPDKSADKPENTAYLAALKTALAELSESVSEHEALEERLYEADKRIGKLRRGAIGLAALCGKTAADLAAKRPELLPDHIDPDTGLTDAVREVLKSAAPGSCSPVYIRDSLKAKGYDMSEYKNVLASIHTILKRLAAKGEVKDSNSPEGRTVYKWAKKSPTVQF